MIAAREEFLAKVKRQVERAVNEGVLIGQKGGRPASNAEVIAICVAALAEEYAQGLAAPARGLVSSWLVWAITDAADGQRETLLSAWPTEAEARRAAAAWAGPTRVTHAQWSGALPPGIVP